MMHSTPEICRALAKYGVKSWIWARRSCRRQKPLVDDAFLSENCSNREGKALRHLGIAAE